MDIPTSTAEVLHEGGINNQQPTPIIPSADSVSPTSPAADSSEGVVPTPKKSFPWLPIIFSLLFAATLAAGAFFFFRMQSLQKQLTTTNSPSPTASAEVLAKEDPTSNWQTYSDQSNNLSFKHPASYTIEIQPRDDGRGKSYLFKPDYLVNLSVLSKYSVTEAKNFMGTASSGNIMIGEINWQTYYLEHGTSGTVGEEVTRFAVQSEINKHIVTFTFLNQNNITDDQKQILSTFRFAGQ